MAKIDMLSAAKVKSVKKPGYYLDGRGLYLQVRGETSKSWLLKYSIDKRPRAMGLGSALDFSLAEARERRDELRKLIKRGVDPLDRKASEKQAAKIEAARVITFRAAAERLIENNRGSWKNAKHGKQWTATLENYAFPVIGDLPVQSVNTELVTKILADIWLNKAETASRVRSRIENVIDSAKVRGEFIGENPARLKGHLAKILPKRSKQQSRVKKHAALPYTELPAFLQDLRTREGIAAEALLFQILTASRPGNAMGARWNEFDITAGVWTIAEEHMKAGVEHKVSLNKAALAVLARMEKIRVGEFVFFGGDGDRPLSDAATGAMIDRMNAARELAGLARWIDPKSKKSKKDIVPHGFRSTFRDWAAERGYPDAVAEAALAHTVSDDVVAAYRRTTFDELRKKMLEDWATFATSDPAHSADVLAFAPLATAN